MLRPSEPKEQPEILFDLQLDLFQSFCPPVNFNQEMNIPTGTVVMPYSPAVRYQDSSFDPGPGVELEIETGFRFKGIIDQFSQVEVLSEDEVRPKVSYSLEVSGRERGVDALRMASPESRALETFMFGNLSKCFVPRCVEIPVVALPVQHLHQSRVLQHFHTTRT